MPRQGGQRALRAPRRGSGRGLGGPQGDHEQLITALGPGKYDFDSMVAIADLLPVMLAYADADLTVGYVNQPMADWFDLPRERLVGRRIVDLLGEERIREREPFYRRALAGERLYFASELDHPTRGNVALQSTFVPWAGVDGIVRGILIIQQDVTEQRAAERALRESEQRFRRIANSAPALMWVTRLDRVRDFVNDAYAAFACGPGCDFEEARTLDWRGRIHPDDVERVE